MFIILYYKEVIYYLFGCFAKDADLGIIFNGVAPSPHDKKLTGDGMLHLSLMRSGIRIYFYVSGKAFN